MNQMNRLILAAACSALVLLQMETGSGQEPEVRSDEQRAAHRARMKELAGSFQVFAVPGKKQSEAKLVAEPVLRYGDSTRKNDEGSLWIWQSGGRPTAIAGIEFYPSRPKEAAWLFEIASLSSERISVQRGDDLAWTAKEPGAKWQPIANADPPADKPVRRLAQMKELSRRFTAHERETTEGRLELRPLTSPLYRYSDAASDVLDGAIFSFANGTNPEVLLVLEAYKVKGATQWRFALAQMTGAKVIVLQDGKQVWERGEADPPAVRDSYLNGWIASEPRGE
jgi:hypothetical protein